MFVKACIVGIIAYLIGSISSSILIGKLYGIDIRNYGSGNAGTTNTLRTMGKKAGAAVFLIDALKGVLAVIIGRLILGDMGAGIAMVLVMIGHNYPIFFGFRGGKGVATAIGAITTVSPAIGAIIILIGCLVVLLTRYISLASITVAILLPFITYFIDKKYIIPILFAIVLVIYKHKSNISRLLAGTESKIGQKVHIEK
jgi:glycerol-3-phosphate acyltransferase PlsY